MWNRTTSTIADGGARYLDMPTIAMLQREYEELGALILLVHQDQRFKMNAWEYVNDVIGENVQEIVFVKEVVAPPVSGE